VPHNEIVQALVETDDFDDFLSRREKLVRNLIERRLLAMFSWNDLGYITATTVTGVSILVIREA
jgi:hypothetical protein